MLFVSGQVGKHPETGEIPDDIEGQTTRVMQNIEGILKDGGMNFANVVKTTIFLADFKDFATVNAIYGACFTGDYPARETVEVSRLPLDVLVEISVIAIK
jgi:2-iminobutanoate/2-iminopropanoate deaminase